jgi:hypothetical protein
MVLLIRRKIVSGLIASKVNIYYLRTKDSCRFSLIRKFSYYFRLEIAEKAAPFSILMQMMPSLLNGASMRCALVVRENFGIELAIR